MTTTAFTVAAETAAAPYNAAIRDALFPYILEGTRERMLSRLVTLLSAGAAMQAAVDGSTSGLHQVAAEAALAGTDLPASMASRLLRLTLGRSRTEALSALGTLTAAVMDVSKAVLADANAPTPQDAGLTAPALQPRLGLLRTQVPYAVGTLTTTANTFHTTFGLDGDFDMVRVLWHNDQSTTPTITAASVAVSAELGDGHNPINEDGSAGVFTPLTFNAAGSLSLLPPPAGDVRTLTMPTAADANVPVFAASDWLPLRSLRRRDVPGARPLLMVRQFAAAGFRLARANNSGFPADWAAASKGREIVNFYQSGNVVQAAFSAPNGPGPWLAATGVQFYSRARGATVLCTGDSLMQGHALQSTEFYSPVHYATARMSTLALPITLLNGGWSGSSSPNYMANARKHIDLFQPDVLVLTAWTPNDTRDAATLEQSWARLLATVHYAISKGVIPIISTAVPFDLSEASDVLRRTANDRARSMGAAGAVLVADFDRAVSTGLTPARSRTGLHASSGSHLSPAGYEACGEALVPVLRKALGL